MPPPPPLMLQWLSCDPHLLLHAHSGCQSDYCMASHRVYTDSIWQIIKVLHALIAELCIFSRDESMMLTFCSIVCSELFTCSSFLRSAACSFTSSPSVDRFNLSSSSTPLKHHNTPIKHFTTSRAQNYITLYPACTLDYNRLHVYQKWLRHTCYVQ